MSNNESNGDDSTGIGVIGGVVLLIVMIGFASIKIPTPVTYQQDRINRTNDWLQTWPFMRGSLDERLERKDYYREH